MWHLPPPCHFPHNLWHALLNTSLYFPLSFSHDLCITPSRYLCAVNLLSPYYLLSRHQENFSSHSFQYVPLTVIQRSCLLCLQFKVAMLPPVLEWEDVSMPTALRINIGYSSLKGIWRSLILKLRKRRVYELKHLPWVSEPVVNSRMWDRLPWIGATVPLSKRRWAPETCGTASTMPGYLVSGAVVCPGCFTLSLSKREELDSWRKKSGKTQNCLRTVQSSPLPSTPESRKLGV